MSNSSLYRTAAGIGRKHSRLSLIAAAAATTGVLGAGVAVGTAPWSQAAGSAAKTTQSDPTASGRTDASLANAFAGVKAHGTTHSSRTQLDSLSSGAAGGSTATIPAVSSQPAQHQAAKPAAAKSQAAQSQPAKAEPAKAQLVKAQPAKQQPAKAQPAKAQVVKAQPAKAQPAKAQVAEAVKPKAPAAPAQPYLIYDSVTPSSIPGSQAAAVYANGAYAASSAQVSGHHSVLWIDTNGSDPGANALDVEPGDATPAGAAAWVQQRLSTQPKSVAIVYTMMSDWQQVKDNVAHLPTWMQSKVRYWIADPTGSPHVVPGASATQWYWGNSYDITTATPGFTG